MENTLPENVAKKYEALIVPRELILPGGERVDMRKMSLKQASKLSKLRPQYLKLKEKQKPKETVTNN